MQLKLESQNQANLIASIYCLSMQCGTLLLSLVKMTATKQPNRLLWALQWSAGLVFFHIHSLGDGVKCQLYLPMA
jgi:hypothetical protein